MNYALTPAIRNSLLRCNAVYSEGESAIHAAFTALNCVSIAVLTLSDAQAVISVPLDGTITLTICGTRFTAGNLSEKLYDLEEDAEFFPVDIGNGKAVASGALKRMKIIWEWVKASLPNLSPQTLIRIEGHSLGGQTAHVAPAVVPENNIYELISWEPPKAANDAYWDSLKISVKTFVNGTDPWAAWPWLTESVKHPKHLFWLHADDCYYILRESWPGNALGSSSDHFPDAVLKAFDAAKIKNGA